MNVLMCGSLLCSLKEENHHLSGKHYSIHLMRIMIHIIYVVSLV